MAATPSKFDHLPRTLASFRDFNAAKGIFIIALAVVLYLAHAAFVPVALALLFALILSSPVEALHRAGVSRALSALLILILTFVAISGLVALMWTPAQTWYASAPHTLAVIQAKITPLARLVTHLQELTHRAGEVGSAGHPAAATTVAVASDVERPSTVFLAIRDSAVGFTSFTVITLFLLAGGPPMVARMTAAFFDHLKANHVLRYIEKVREEVGHFYVISALINLGLGIATTLVMMAWGMPSPYLWGVMAAVLNFIPYAGSAVTLVVVTVVAVVSFPGLGHAAGVSIGYLGLATIEGQLAQPLLVGRRLEVNPLLIFLGLWFGGFFWGIAGVILATPTLVALKVVSENAADGKSMLQFLGPNEDAPPRHQKLRKVFSRAPKYA